jgi:hypothetical protein
MTNLKSAWKPIFNINPQYIKGFQFNDSYDGEQPSSLLKDIRKLMVACGMHRIFSGEDMRIFLSRLVILHRKENAVKELVGLKDPLSYIFDYDKSKVTLGDIFRYHGIEIYDYTNSYISEEGFRGKLAGAWSVNDRSETTYEPVIPSDHLLEEAKTFAQKALDLAPKDLFLEQERFEEKLEEIRLRKEAIDRIPEYDLEKIPVDIRNQCMQIMFSDEFDIEDIEDIRLFPEDHPSFLEDEEKYMYLAWLYANELICYDMGMAWLVEGVDLDLGRYSLNHPELGPMGLEYTIEQFNIPETERLLKGVL